MAQRKVEIKVPLKGEKVKLVEMAERNAKITLENKERANKNLMLEMKEKLELEKVPRKIEAYDISNISGEYLVAAMCVMMDGVIKKNLSRKFKIKTVVGQDDPRCMEEVVTRRLRHSIILKKDNVYNNIPKETLEKYGEDKGFGKLPDMILADGGITQIRAIMKALRNIEEEANVKLDIDVYGMVKNDKHQTRALLTPERQEVQVSDELFNLITNFQDTVHDTAIGYHKLLRDKSMTQSSLDDIKGIGDAKKKELLKKFRSVEKIKDADIEEIIKIKGINEDLANEIKNKLQ
jgi:excinuclease ABC subunit C